MQPDFLSLGLPFRDADGTASVCHLKIFLRRAVEGLQPEGHVTEREGNGVASQNGALQIRRKPGLFAVGFRLRHRQSNRLGRLISLAVLATLLAQTGFYILANLGLPILFSASLPLVSFGGSALIVNMILPGVLLSTFRMDSIARDRPGKAAAAAA
jgi:hypothetical protein